MPQDRYHHTVITKSNEISKISWSAFLVTRKLKLYCGDTISINNHMASANIFTARVRSMTGRYCFHTWGRVTHLHPIILPLVPCPFHGCTPVTGPRSLLGVPQWLVPGLFLGGTPPGQVRTEGTPGWRVPPSQGWGMPLVFTQEDCLVLNNFQNYKENQLRMDF